MPDEKTSRQADPKPDWDGPAQNPEFNGATPRDLARALLRKVDERRKPAEATSAAAEQKAS